MLKTALIAAGSLLLAGSAFAQPYGGYGHYHQARRATGDLHYQIDALTGQLHGAEANRQLSPREVSELGDEIHSIREQYMFLRQRDGGALNDRDRYTIEDRLNHFNQKLYHMAHNRER